MGSFFTCFMLTGLFCLLYAEMPVATTGTTGNEKPPHHGIYEEERLQLKSSSKFKKLDGC